jgi:hypothetical protein
MRSEVTEPFPQREFVLLAETSGILIEELNEVPELQWGEF